MKYSLPASIPEPHPLDFDWRYNQATIDRLKSMLRGKGPILALGAPSIARALEATAEPVLLVDRQPCQGVSNHWVHEIGVQTDLAANANTVIADPPWYPGDVLNWAAIAGRAVGPGRVVFISIWLDSARPSAAEERRSVLRNLESWAAVVEHRNMLHYEMPRFEQEAVRLSGLTSLSTSPRVGSLLELQVLREPVAAAKQERRDEWVRYTVDDYQLAARVASPTGDKVGILRHPEAKGWKWPYVSARAPGFSKIDVWSSSGEVAMVPNSPHLIAALRRAFTSDTVASFEESLADYPDLLTWAIPRPPYRRSVEWRHHV